MSKILTSIKYTVHATDDYEYEVTISPDSVRLTYIEFENNKPVIKQNLSFGSVVEMEAVAKAMENAYHNFRSMDGYK